MPNTTDRLYRMPIGDFLRRRPEAQSCQACGSPLPHGAVFCASCGVRADDPQAEPRGPRPGPRPQRGGAGGERGAKASGRPGGGRTGLRTPGSAWARGRRHREREPVAAFGSSRDDGQARLTLEIYLARHGETEWSLSGRHTGTTDLPLTPRGEDKARALRQRLSGIQFDAVYSSPMQRAWRTAELAGFQNPQITPLLQEVDYGRYEGLTTKQIHESDPDWELYKDGSPGGETPQQIYTRAQEFIALATRHPH